MTLRVRDGHLEKDGNPFLYAADTLWAAFTHVALDDWEDYLLTRRAQGFNAVQVSLLPILKHASGVAQPFPSTASGGFRFDDLDRRYLERVVSMLARAREAGITPVVILFWTDYVAGTTAAARHDRIIPDALIDSLTDTFVDTIAPFEPVLVVAGDTDFPVEGVDATYLRILERIRARAPGLLTAIHVSADTVRLPVTLERSGLLDLHLFQSGHSSSEQARAFTVPDANRAAHVPQVLINGEPCYEGMGHFERFGRFDAGDVRRAIWQSFLATGGAGVTYGAHGVWQWHQAPERPEAQGAFSHPFEWPDAMRLPGARTVGDLRHIVERFELYAMEPRQGVIERRAARSLDEFTPPAPGDDCRAAMSGHSLVVYSPSATDLDIAEGRADRRVAGFMVEDGREFEPVVTDRPDAFTVAQPQANGDFVVVVHP